MAVVPMKKLTLVGVTSEKKLLLDALHKTGCVELKPAEEIPGTRLFYDEHASSVTAERQTRVEAALAFIDSCESVRAHSAKKKDSGDVFKKPSAPLFSCRSDVSFDEFMGIASREYELNEAVAEVLKLESEMRAGETETGRIQNQTEQLKVYLGVDAPFTAFTASKNTVFALGQLPEQNTEKLRAAFKPEEPVYLRECGRASSLAAMAVVYLKADAESVKQRLSEAGFAECAFRENGTAAEKTAALCARLEEIETRSREIVKIATEYGKYRKELKLLSDYYKIERHKAESDRDTRKTEASFVLEAWLPAPSEELVGNSVLAVTNAVALYFDDPRGDEEPPTVTQNPMLISAYESVTNMYSSPSPREKDPNLFVAMFFFLFFGIMVSDAGYGIILTVATLLIMKLFRLETPMKKMMLVLCMGGVSTLIWGAVFGTWFGVGENEWAPIKYFSWFNPLNEPIKMLILCLALGLFQILFGMGISAVNLIRQRRIMDAIAEVFSWYVFFIGVLVLIFGMFFFKTVAAVSTAGLIMMGIGLAVVVCTAGHKKKGILGKIMGGLGGLYNVVNFLSDILSYARLFGLGVATGVIGFTMNTLAGLMFGNWYTVIFGVAILIVGHAFNIAINTLGAYIHNSRLQYVEFFGKFFEGGGYEFEPLGFDTQYVRVAAPEIRAEKPVKKAKKRLLPEQPAA